MSDLFQAATHAAGALALEVREGGALRLEGKAGLLGLSGVQASGRFDDLSAAAAPGDRASLAELIEGRRVDARIRLIGEDGALRYARLIGGPQSEVVWRGLLLPAGASPTGGLAALDLETGLRQALEEGAVIAHHQPVIALADRRLAGFEALARWERPDGSALGPEVFMGVAADTGLIGAIGDAVRSSAARDAAAWRVARPGAKSLFVAANATASELCAPAFAERLIDEVQRDGLPPHAFKLEISETEIMRDPEAAEAAMKTLRKAGFSLVLDDFGTGYSSLSRLDRFPFDTVKIDQYFTRLAETDQSARTIIAGVVRIARSYDMTIVAEGVETEAAAKLCTELGCDYGQGFRYAQALTPEDAADAVMSGIEGRFSAP
jgi:EAL domain-containing protein (putative c-di-GMP-specific phosphodiesterase class I)